MNSEWKWHYKWFQYHFEIDAIHSMQVVTLMAFLCIVFNDTEWINFPFSIKKNEHVLWRYFPRSYSSVKWMDAILLEVSKSVISQVDILHVHFGLNTVRCVHHCTQYWWTTQMMFDVYASVKMIAQIENRFQSSKWTFVLFIINAMCAGWLTEPFNGAVSMRQWIFSLFNRNPTFSCQNRKNRDSQK